MKRTFFEQLGAADIERIHSQMLAWIFSNDFYGFDKHKECRIRLIEKVFGLNISDVNRTLAESEKIDLQIDCLEVLIIIENKIKTSQHSNQLARYRETIQKKYPDKKVTYFLLTLCEEQCLDTHWKNVSYTQILSVLDEINTNKGINNNFHGMILLDYMETIRKFTTVIFEFINDTKNYDRVFLEGKATKKVKLQRGIDELPNEKFIRQNQLETILQMYYFQKVRSYLKDPMEYYIVETRGNAILGRHIVRGIRIGEKLFHLGMDFQDGSFKTMLIADDYYNSTSSDFTEEIHYLYKSLTAHPENMGYMYFNKPRNRAQISLTNRKLKSIKWWHLSPKEFAIEFQKEVNNVDLLIKKHLLSSLSIYSSNP